MLILNTASKLDKLTKKNYLNIKNYTPQIISQFLLKGETDKSERHKTVS